MAKITIELADGSTYETVGKKLKYKINGREFEFAVHAPVRYSAHPLQVTHLDSGKSVTFVVQRQLAAANGNHVTAAVLALGELVRTHRPDRVAAVLLGAGG